MNEWKKKVLEHYGEQSKQYLIASLYDQVPVRDNLGNLNIVDNMKDVINMKMNYIVIPRAPTPSTVVLNVYKIADKYETQKYKLDSKLTNSLRNYISNNAVVDKILFKTARQKTTDIKLSGFLSNMNKKLEIKGAVNFTRKSNIKEKIQNKSGVTSQDEAVLSRKMGHSVQTQKTYMTGVKK